MCDSTRQTFSIIQRLVSLLDIETASFAYHGQIDKAKAAAELASELHDALIKFSQDVCKAEAKEHGKGPQPWVPDDGINSQFPGWNVPSGFAK